MTRRTTVIAFGVVEERRGEWSGTTEGWVVTGMLRAVYITYVFFHRPPRNSDTIRKPSLFHFLSLLSRNVNQVPVRQQR